MKLKPVEVVWPALRDARTGRFTIAPLRTGGFVQTTFAAVGMSATRVGHGDPLLANAEPWFAGYCLDAPEFLAAGSHRSRHLGTPEMTSFAR